MMNKRKKYLLGTLFVFLSLIVTLSQVSIWENHLKSTLMKKINQYDWNLNVDELSGNFISTLVMKDLIFEKENSKRIIIDKISINLGIFSSLFGLGFCSPDSYIFEAKLLQTVFNDSIDDLISSESPLSKFKFIL